MAKIIEQIGTVYGDYKIICKDIDKTKAAKRAYYLVECVKCKTQILKSGTDLRLGRGIFCKQCKKNNKQKEEIGKKYGRLEIIEFSHIGTDRHYNWKCKCECGNIETLPITILRSGKKTQCNECNKQEKIKQYIDETNKKYNNLLVLSYDKEKSGKNAYWICKCDCGNIISVKGASLRNGHTKSCGCIKSFGEQKIIKILQENNITYKAQYSFIDCKDKDLLKFDFAIFENNNLSYLIEYDGIQHFQYKENGWNNKQNMLEIQKRDKIKDRYCQQNNIPLIRIPYVHFDNLCIEDLQLETSNFIVGRTY